MDQTADGRRLKWRPICAEFSRELVAARDDAGTGLIHQLFARTCK